MQLSWFDDHGRALLAVRRFAYVTTLKLSMLSGFVRYSTFSWWSSGRLTTAEDGEHRYSCLGVKLAARRMTDDSSGSQML